MIYFIKSGNYVKIGYSKEPKQRLKELQTANPLKLTLMGTIPGTYSTEKALHSLYNKYKKRGEWFNCKKDLSLCVEALKKGYKATDITEFQQIGLRLYMERKVTRINREKSYKLKQHIKSASDFR